jgi:hypothetical protein
MWVVSAFALAITMACCFAGTFAPKHIYDDNIAQRIGMAGVFMVCWPRFWHLIDNQGFVGNCLPVTAQIFGHVGLAAYCAGTAWKVWRHKPKRKPPPPPISAKHLHSVRGGSK